MLFPCEPFEKFFNPLSRGAVAGSCELRKIFARPPAPLCRVALCLCVWFAFVSASCEARVNHFVTVVLSATP